METYSFWNEYAFNISSIFKTILNIDVSVECDRNEKSYCFENWCNVVKAYGFQND